MQNIQAVLFAIFLLPSKNIFCQTLSPLYINNDSINVSGIQFINPANGSRLKSKAEGQLVHINSILPDFIKIVIPFKNGKESILDSVETKYFYDRCVIYIDKQNKSYSKTCSTILYYPGDRLIGGKMTCFPGSTGIQIHIMPYNIYYDDRTKGLKIDIKKRWRLIKRNQKKKLLG